MYVGSYWILINDYFLKCVFHHGLDHKLLKKASEIICHCLGLKRQHPATYTSRNASATRLRMMFSCQKKRRDPFGCPDRLDGFDKFDRFWLGCGGNIGTSPASRQYICSQIIATSHDLPKWWLSKGNPLISGKPRLVKYYYLARYMCLLTFLSYHHGIYHPIALLYLHGIIQ